MPIRTTQPVSAQQPSKAPTRDQLHQLLELLPARCDCPCWRSRSLAFCMVGFRQLKVATARVRRHWPGPEYQHGLSCKIRHPRTRFGLVVSRYERALELVRLLAIRSCTTTNDARWHHDIRFYTSFFSCLNDGDICSSLRVGRNVFSTLLILKDVVLFVGECSSFDVSFGDPIVAQT